MKIQEINFSSDGTKISIKHCETNNEENIIEETFDLKVDSNVNSNDLGDEQLAKIVAQNLGVPKDINVTYEISKKYYWDAGERYFKNVSFYENEELVATASVDPVTGELIKNIALYQFFEKKT